MSHEDQFAAESKAGNTVAFRVVVEQHHHAVFRFVRNMIGNQHDAEDVVQEVFLAAFNSFATFDERRASMKTWLFTIARNRSINWLKRSRTLAASEMVAQLPSSKANDEKDRLEFWRQLNFALAELPVDQKVAFVLAEIEGLPYAEIATIEQINLGTVKSRIYRAKQRLREALSPVKEK